MSARLSQVPGSATPSPHSQGLLHVGVVLIGLAFLMSASACSVILGGRTQTLTVTTDPAGARVTINGNMVGVSPMQYPIKRKETAAVMASKTGYMPSMRTTERHISPCGIIDGIGGFFTFGFMWLGLLSPGAWKQEPANIMMILPPNDEVKK